MNDNELPKVLMSEVQVTDLFFYQKTEVLYALTYHFVKKYLPAHGDRTVDQMVQAARSGKQNIVEGFSDGVTSTELQLKLLNVARASLKELRADFEDYLVTRDLPRWNEAHPRYSVMLAFCRTHNRRDDYQPYFDRWGDEELANVALTLLHMVDKMMKTYLTGLEAQFITQGGIRERMHAARTGYRQGLDEDLRRLREESKTLREESKALRQQVSVLEQQNAQLQAEKRHLEVLLQQERMKKR